MKKLLSSILAGIICLSLYADEGMWMLPLLQKFNSDAMRNLGSRLTTEQIYSINSTSLKDAIVMFGGGCTGEVISDEGLVVTNHHCGYASIQKLSTPEQNYLEDGFFALTKDQEIPVPGLTVTFMKSMTDVTAVFEKLESKVPEAIDAAKKALEEQAGKDNPGCRAVVTSFYNDNVYYLIVYKIFKDIRFVGAPPASMGKFGGETDNWMWPRHTCDFSMFRIYADENNEPAEYSESNRPYNPVKSLKISLKGVQEGDFAFIMGYPGSTQRFQTAEQLQNMIDRNRIRIDARTVRQKVMKEEMEKDPTVRLQYANKYASSSNGWKKWQGEELAFEKLNIIGREKEKEQEYTSWVNDKKKRSQKYGGAIEEIDKNVQKSAEPYAGYTLLTETIGRIELLSLAMAGDDEYGGYKDYNVDVDRKISKALFEHYLDNVQQKDKVSIPGWDLSRSNLDSYLDYLFSSVFTSEESKRAGVEKGGLNTDPANELSFAIMDKVQDFYKPIRNSRDEIKEASKKYTAGLLDWQNGKASYPDANFTMRLTYGNVKAYSPKDGIDYRYYTTINGVLEKEDPSNYEFRVPAKVKQLANNKDFGQYADANGNLVTCFLTNCDITGGNSGSPVLDADGNLIGLAFDGNWESMSSDVMFEPDLQRCICVDIRYVLWMVDKFAGASNIINEITILK